MLKDKCINFERSMNEVCLVVNHNTDVTGNYAYLTHDAEINCDHIKPSEQMTKLAFDELEDKDYKKIINNFIENVKENVILINQNIESFRNCLHDNDVSSSGHEYEDVIFDMENIEGEKNIEELEKYMDILMDKVKEITSTLNVNI